MKVVLEASWASMEEGGKLRLFVPFGEARSGAVAEELAAGALVDVAPIERMMQPLGRFRAALGARFDLRFLSFEIQLVFHDPNSGRPCVAAGSANDPEGREMGPCFECVLPTGTVSLCREGEAWPAALGGPTEAKAQLGAALAAGP